MIEGLKTRAATLSEQAAGRLKSGERLRAAGLNTGDTGASRAAARAALDAVPQDERSNRASRLLADCACVPAAPAES